MNVICLPQLTYLLRYNRFLFVFKNTKFVIIFGVLLFVYFVFDFAKVDVLFDKLFDGDEWMSFYGGE